jgi:hypothetical protein
MQLSFGNLVDYGPDAGDPRRGTFATGSTLRSPRDSTGSVLGTPVRTTPSPTIVDDGLRGSSRPSSTRTAPSGFGLGIPTISTERTRGGALTGLLGLGISANDFTFGSAATDPLPSLPSWNLGTLAPNTVSSGPIREIPTASTVDLDGGSDFLSTLRDLAGEAIAGIGGRDRTQAQVQPASFGMSGGGFSPQVIIGLMVAAAGAFYLLSGE